ncbi:MAG: cytidine deaminase [Wenzhouxiangellaceae bacterium]
MSEIDFSSLCRLAEGARDRAYAPYSRHPVGAVVVTPEGRAFSGCNVENAAYPLGQCAEASAIAAMAVAGERRIRHVIIAGPGETPCMPCGGCRQKIWEFADADTCIHICVGGKIVQQQRLVNLLPAAFGSHNLRAEE